MNQLQALEIMLSGENCFLTGAAGTGKTYTMQELIKRTRSVGEVVIVVAPTGIAAINIGGATIHSTFKMFGNYLHDKPFKRQSVDWRRVDRIIIEEISMVGPDYIDYIDLLLRRETGINKPFGGIQIIMVGDKKQLKPVYGSYTDQDKADLSGLLLKYGTLTFEHAKAYQGFTEIELDEPQRTKDPRFIALLNKVRDGDFSAIPEFQKGYGTENSIHLKPYNNMVDLHNQIEFDKLAGKVSKYTAIVSGKFNTKNCITPEFLELKPKARIMVTKNMQNGLVNGDLGYVVSCNGNGVEIYSDRLKQSVFLEPEEWKEVTYDGVQEIVVGRFEQIPLKLSWAMTIHKSQGLSLENVCLSYSSGMSKELVYVGVSRCTSFEGLFVYQS